MSLVLMPRVVGPGDVVSWGNRRDGYRRMLRGRQSCVNAKQNALQYSPLLEAPSSMQLVSRQRLFVHRRSQSLHPFLQVVAHAPEVTSFLLIGD